SPPRILKAPIGVWFSCLTQSSAPTRRDSNGQQYCGVGGTEQWTSAAAASKVSRSIVIIAPAFGCVAPVGSRALTIVRLFPQPGQPVAERDVVAPRGPSRSEFGGVAAVPLPQIDDNRGIDRDAREIVQ